MKQLFIIFAISVQLLTTCLAQSEKASLTRPANKQKIIPIADYNPPEIKNPEENELRKLRNSKFDMSKSLNSTETINNFRLTERSFNSGYFIISKGSSGRIFPAFPVLASKLIVIGKIVEGKAFLSNDKTAVYSEYTLEIEDILKQNSDLSVTKNSKIDVLRLGGGVRFPSGKVYYRELGGYAMPEVDGRYLMFLYEDSVTKSFSEMAGYKLQSGEVFPLDGADEDKVATAFQEQYKYKRYRENDFIDIIKKQIVNIK